MIRVMREGLLHHYYYFAGSFLRITYYELSFGEHRAISSNLLP